MHNWKHFQAASIALTRETFDTERQCKQAIAKFEKYVRTAMDARNLPEESWFLFCPVFGGQCRTDCVCFKEHMMVTEFDRSTTPSTTKYRVRDWECRHALVQGLIYIEKN